MAGSRTKKRGAVESWPVLSSYELNRTNGFDVGVTSYRVWSRGGAVVARAAIKAADGCVFIKSSGETQRIETTQSTRFLGGYVTYFLCSDCGRRTVTLAAVGGWFACRFCHRLSYRSESYRRGVEPHLNIARRIRACFGGSGNMMEPFPSRPRYCHHQRYLRALAKASEVEGKLYAAMSVELHRLKK